jgi:hypothetical protein
MTTIDLRQHKTTIEELLHLADGDIVVIIAENGREFVLEEADDFEKEVAWLSGSAKFIDFLKVRAKEPATISIDDLEKELGLSGD